MPKGDIVLLPFPFTNLAGSKLRPALVLAETASDTTVSFITTQLHWREPTDITLTPNSVNGIKQTSLVRLTKIATIDRTLIKGKIGIIDSKTVIDLNQKLKTVLQIP